MLEHFARADGDAGEGVFGDENGKETLALMRFDRLGHLDRGFGRRGMLTAKLESTSHPTQVISTPAGPLVVLSAGRKPLLTFGPGGSGCSNPAPLIELDTGGVPVSAGTSVTLDATGSEEKALIELARGIVSPQMLHETLEGFEPVPQYVAKA